MAKPLIPATRDEDGQIVLWKTPYNHDVMAETIRTGTLCKDPSLTQQHFKDEQDINVIVSRVIKTGALPDIPVPLNYGDLTTMEDYHTMQTKLAETRALFYRLDPKTRAEYANDPGAWLEDVNQKIADGDLEPLREMGLDMKSVDAQIERIKAEQADQAKAELLEKAKADEAAKASKASQGDAKK